MYENLDGYTVSTDFVRLLTEFAQSRALDLDRFLAANGLDSEALDHPEGRMAFSDYARLLDSLAEHSHDPHIGLALGCTARVGHLGTSGLAQMACSTVKELLPRMARYNSLVMDAFEDDLQVTDGEIVLCWRRRIPENVAISRHHAELNFALTQTLIPQFTGDQIFPTRVWFRHPPPDDPELLNEFFRCQVRFDAPVNLMACDAEVLARDLHAPDPVTLQLLDRICEQQLKALEDLQEPDWLLACKQAITQALKDGQPEFSLLTEASGYGARQLRRKLAERGLHFRGLIDTCRQDLASAYMLDPDLSLVDVAMLLGFSEQSAFQRAYRRWTGESPGSARSRLLG